MVPEIGLALNPFTMVGTWVLPRIETQSEQTGGAGVVNTAQRQLPF